jgi:TonB family protein
MEKMNRIILVVAILFIVTASSYAQLTKYLGRVIDKDTQRPVSNANIRAMNTEVKLTSNALGYFEITGDTLELIITHVNYNPVSVNVNPSNSKFGIEIQSRIHDLPPLDLSDSIILNGFTYNLSVIEELKGQRSNSEIPYEYQAEFPGGPKNFHNFIITKIFESKDSTIESFNSNILFSINMEGKLIIDSISSPSISKSSIIGIIESSPAWVPAYQNGQPLDSRYDLHIGYNSQAQIFKLIEEQPEYKGGMAALYAFFDRNLKYPKEAKRKGTRGRVYVSFVIGKNGEIDNVSTFRSLGDGCDEEAERLIALTSGNWIPGKQMGKPVRVKMTLPIRFDF